MLTLFRAPAAILLTGWALAAQAQTAPATEPRTVVAYFDANHSPLPSAEGASVRVETQYQDSVGGTVRTFDVTGRLLEQAPFEDIRRQVLHGTRQVWYATGQLRWQATAVHGKRHGELLSYYPNGQLKRREQYEQGKRLTGECFGPDGQPVPFFEFETMPAPANGLLGLMKYLSRNVRYPAAALRERVQGQVLVRFWVDTLGQVHDVAVEQSLHPALDAEALRVIAAQPAWQPGRLDGLPIRMVVRVPVTFAIAGPPPRTKRPSEADF